ncbi:hypothetical protein ACGP04_00240 [Piscirickettsia salmonis]|uniref:hypothetical protein n=1 Tax=Piscirickettsia salmonis TaxID=1238 RepID=UPI000F074293|nr:hypothetical protein DA717_06065 [Piscirickettsiaceae bacterium NZ-RLO2]
MSYEQVQAITQALTNARIYRPGIEEELEANQDLQDALFALVNTQGVNLADSVNSSVNALKALQDDRDLTKATVALANLDALTYQSWRSLQANPAAQIFYQSLHRDIGTPIPKRYQETETPPPKEYPAELMLNNRKNREALAQYQRAACALANRFTYDLDSPETQRSVTKAWKRIETDPIFATAVAVLGENKALSLESLRTTEKETEETALLVRAIAAFDNRDHFFSSDALKVNTDRFTDLQTANPLSFSDPSQPFSYSSYSDYWKQEVWPRIHGQKDSKKYQKLACILDDSDILTHTVWDIMKDNEQCQKSITLLHDNGLLPLSSKALKTASAQEQTELLTAVRHLHQAGILPDNLYQAQLVTITLAMNDQPSLMPSLEKAMQSENPAQSIIKNPELMNVAAQKLTYQALAQAQELKSSESSTDQNKALLATSLKRKLDSHDLSPQQTLKSLARVLSRREGWFKYRRNLEKDGSDMPESYNRGKLRIEAARDLLQISAPAWGQALRSGEDKGENPAYQTYNNLLKFVAQEDREKLASQEDTRTIHPGVTA